MIQTSGFETRHGPRDLGDGRFEFRLWAPSCDAVSLEIDGAESVTMQKGHGGWFAAVHRADLETTYRFRVGPDLLVSDPASRFQPDGVHGPSRVIAAVPLQSDQWHGRPWHEAVVYELHVGLLGGYAGVAERLDELAALGITAIELMPLNTFGGNRNWGYDGVLPFAPHPAYGTPADLRSLIDSAHARHIAVIIDVVYNHFGPDGNYLGVYADAFFDDETNSPWGRGIAFADPNVAAFFHENALMWLKDYGFDGLRIDAAWAIGDRQWFETLHARVRETCGPDRHVYLILENENNDASLLAHGYDAQWNDDFHNTVHVLLTGETEGYYGQYENEPTSALATILKEGFYYQGQTPPGGTKGRGQKSAALPCSAFVNFLQNHDQTGNRALGERLISLAHTEALQAAYTLLLLSPSIPMLFMGEEWGSRTPFAFFTDYHDELDEQVREGRRREFEKFEAFRNPETREKIPDPNRRETFTASIPDRGGRETPEGRTWLELTHALLLLRGQHVTPHIPQTRSAGCDVLGDHAVLARWTQPDAELILAVNLGPRAVKMPPITRPDVIFTTSESSAWHKDGQHTLPPYSVTAARKTTS